MKKIYSLRSIAFSIAFLAILFTGSNVLAQDIHFSQFYASPLTLNPALTGKVNGSFRIAGIFRSQWGGIPTNTKKPTYGTPSASFDMPIFVGKKKQDAIGLGAMFFKDYSNAGNWSMTRAMLSVSYIKGLGKDGKHQLSLGVQGGIQQGKSGDFRFEDNYVNGEYDENTTSVDEGLNNQSKIIPDFQTGLFYNGQVVNKLTLFAGFSLFHLFTPDDKLGTTGSSKLPRRYVAHGGLQWDFAKKVSLYPGVIYMAQAENSELNFGTNLGYHIKKADDGRNTTLYVGAWYRLNDAIIPMIGMEFKGFRAGFSYDATTSELSNKNTNGSFEVSLIYIGNFLKITDKQTFLFCPRF
jgi:type IX secretion system PorP/SprF family membrane protein